MNRRLLDTDILSEILKGQHPPVAAKSAAYLATHGHLTTSAVSVAEIVYGLRRVGREDRIRQFEVVASESEVLPFDDGAARLAGRINADLERAGLVVGMPDVMIAAIAVCARLPVVTGNVVHFAQIREVGYEVVIENWRDA